MGKSRYSCGLYRASSGSVTVFETDPLFSQVAEGLIIRLAYRGKWLDAFRIERIETEAGDDGLRKVASGRGALAFLEDAIVWYDQTNPGTERELSGTYAGIFLTLLSEAQGRGVFGLPIAATFTADTDSAGNPISGDTVTLRLQVGSTLLDYVRSMWERGIWIRARWNFEQSQIEVDWIEPPYGEDKTETVRFRLQHSANHRREKDLADLTTVLLVKNEDAFLEVVDNVAVSTWGRRERLLTLDNAGSNADAQALASEILARDAEPRHAITLEVEDLDEGPRVFIDYDLGDIIAIYMPDTQDWENWRVVGMTLDFQDHGRAKVSLELNREPADFDIAQARLVQRAALGKTSELAHQGDLAERQKAHEADALAHRNLELGDTGGDVIGTVSSAQVVGLRGRPVANAAPNTGQVLQWDGAQWIPADVADDPALGGDLSGNASNATVVGLRGRPVADAAPATGQVLQWDGSTWHPGSVSGGGGGGGYYENPIDQPPVTPTSYDDEFSGSALDSKWVARYGSVANLAVADGRVYAATGGAAIMQSVPSGTWEITAKCWISGRLANYGNVGLAIEDAGGRVVYLYIIYNSAEGGLAIYEARHNSYSSWNSNRLRVNVDIAEWYLRTAWDGSALSFYYSRHGTFWYPLGTDSGWITNPAYFGLSLGISSGTGSVAEWFRKTA